MKCPNCHATIPDTEDICPACFAQVQTAQEPVTSPCTSAPVGHPREVKNQSEPSSKGREGQECTPPSENAVRGNVEGRFSTRIPRKGLFLALVGILVVILLAIIAGYMVLNRQAPVPTPPVAQEQASTPPAPEKPAEEKPAPAPEKPVEAKPVPPVQKKTVKKAPVPQASPAPAPTPKWTYRPDPQPGKPAPAPQASKKSGIAGWLDKTLGPEKPVTPPPSVSDARGTGM